MSSEYKLAVVKYTRTASEQRNLKVHIVSYYFISYQAILRKIRKSENISLENISVVNTEFKIMLK